MASQQPVHGGGAKAHERGVDVTRALLDTSVVNRLADLDVGSVLEDELVQGHLALCAPVRFEVSYSARNPAHLAQIREVLATFPDVPIRAPMFERAIEVQAGLCWRGGHRGVSMADLLIAAAAEAHDLPVIHYDGDFDRIAEVTGQSVRWVVPRGSVD